jgi:hypothetical protein
MHVLIVLSEVMSRLKIPLMLSFSIIRLLREATVRMQLACATECMMQDNRMVDNRRIGPDYVIPRTITMSILNHFCEQI